MDEQYTITLATLFADVQKFADQVSLLRETHDACKIAAQILKGESAPDVSGTSPRLIAQAADKIARAALKEESWQKSGALLSIFNRLNGGDGNFKYSPKKLNVRINYPVPQAESGDNVKREFSQAVSEFKIQGDGAVDIAEMLDIMEKYLIYVPADISLNTDISLFDKAKLTAALSSCIYQYLNASDNADNRVNLQDNEELFNEKFFLLYSIDLSGIQDFIYSVTSDGALKALRARSFYLELLMEHLVDTVLENCGASRANCIYTGGGHAYIILGNTVSTREKIKAFENSVNSDLLDIFGTGLYLACGCEPFCANDILNKPEGSYAELFRSVSNKISERKLNRYSAREIIKLNDGEIREAWRECSVCGRTDNLSENNKCYICEGLENFSREIQSKDKNYFVISGNSYGNNLPLPGGVFLNTASKEDVQRLKKAPNFKRAYSKNNFSGGESALNLWVGDYQSSATFEELADETQGIKRLAVMRADVDNLGQAFVKGFESEKYGQKFVALPRTATFSRSLSLFFKAHINGILENGEYFLTDQDKSSRAATVVYSGGDDIFIIGAWNDIIGFAVDLHNSLKAYSQNALTISAGIGIYPYKYPVSAMAKETGKLEDKSKLYSDEHGEKNAVTIFDETNTYSWKIFIENVLGEKYALIKEFFNYKNKDRDDEDKKEQERGKAFLYRLLELMRGSGDKLNLARYAYLLARLAPGEKASEEYKELYSNFSKNMYKWIRNEKECREAITAIYIYIYTVREDNKDKERID